MGLQRIIQKYSGGLEINPGGDLANSMIFHNRHINPQILKG